MAYDYQTADPMLYRILRENARHNRNNPKEAERLLWQYLRADSLGATFKRQHAIGGYIADFVCLSHRLIIELDGGYHLAHQQQTADEERTRWLEEHGYRVVRFTNEELFNGIDQVITRIENELYA